MSTLLDTLEPPETATRSFGEELQASMATVRLQLRWFGVRRSVTASQKHRAADMFDAESKFVSMGKKLLDTQHPAWKKLVAVRGNILTTWRNSSLPFPEPGIRLIKRRDLDSFTATMNELRDDLRDAERELDNHYDDLRSTAKTRLGRLYNSDDYPVSMVGLFEVSVDHPNVEAPEYLRMLSPTLYRQETDRVRNRFDEAVRLAEESFLGELSKLVEHLTERLSGTDDGKPKIFRDTVVTNLVEFFDRFRRLNIGSSDELDRMVADVKRIVGNTTADDLRNSELLRKHVSTELSRVQANLDGMMIDRPRRNLIRRNGGANADHR